MLQAQKWQLKTNLLSVIVVWWRHQTTLSYRSADDRATLHFTFQSDLESSQVQMQIFCF